jgi:hypothetical protein
MNKKVTLSYKARRTPDELRESSKHVFWGMRFLSERLEFILRFSKKGNYGEMDGILASIHDSFLIYARKMIEFLYNSTKSVYDNDLIAEDFFNTPETWRSLRPLQPDVLKRAREDVGKLLAHFTYRVKEIPSGRITWETSDIYVGVFLALQKFLIEVDPALLDEQFDYLRLDNINIVICYPVFPPEGNAPYQIKSTRDKASGVDFGVGQ